MSRSDLRDAETDPGSLWAKPPPRDAAATLPQSADAHTAALLDGVLAGIGGPAVLLDARGRIERLNPRAARETGLARGDEFLAKLIAPTNVRASIQEEIARGTPLAFFASPGIEWRTFPIRDDGRLVGTAVFADL